MFNKQPLPEQSFTESIKNVNTLKANIENTRCPTCTQVTLRLGTYTRTPQEWGATVSCSNCDFSGEVNSTGFNFVKINSKGKAVK